MTTIVKQKKKYVAPQTTRLGVATSELMVGSINSYDKDGSEEIKGEESLSKPNTQWVDTGVWDDSI